MPAPKSHRSGRAVLAALVFAPAALSGCNWKEELEYGSHVSRLDPERSSGAFGWHQTELAHTVHFAPGVPTVDPVETVRLNQFIDQVGVRANDDLTAVAGGPMAQQRTASVVQAFALRGHRINAAVDPSLPDGDVTVSIRRVVYTASACLREGHPMSDGSTSLPFGCANALNLQGMVANPDELIDGMPSNSVETLPAVGAIDRYRRGEITPLQVQGTSGSTSSRSSE